MDWAEYKLIVPDYITIKRFSYQPDKIYKIEKNTIYYCCYTLHLSAVNN